MVEHWPSCMWSIITKLANFVISDHLSQSYLNTYLYQDKTSILLQKLINPGDQAEKKQISPVWFISIREPLVTLSIRRIKLASKSKEQSTNRIVKFPRSSTPYLYFYLFLPSMTVRLLSLFKLCYNATTCEKTILCKNRDVNVSLHTYRHLKSIEMPSDAAARLVTLLSLAHST